MTLPSTARITLDRLADACDQQRVIFQELFPNGFEATSEAECVSAARKHASDFIWGWAASRLLTGPARKAYKAAERSAWEAYEAADRSALDAYEDATYSAWEAYKDSMHSARGAHEDAVYSARGAYEAAERVALKIYKSACAEAFGRAFWTQESTQ